MVDHIIFGVKNYDQSVNFYKKTLEILYPNDLKIMEKVLYGPTLEEKLDLQNIIQDYIFKSNAIIVARIKVANFTHTELKFGFFIIDLATGIMVDLLNPTYYDPLIHSSAFSMKSDLIFKAKSQEDVDAWYDKAIELGATCNGPPGPRVMNDPNYYGVSYSASIIDSNGYRFQSGVNLRGLSFKY